MSQSYDQYLDDQLYDQEVADAEFEKFYNSWIDNPEGYKITVSISRPNYDDDYEIDIANAKTREAIMKSLDKVYGRKLSEFYSNEIYLSDLEDRADLDMVREAERGNDEL